MVKVFKVRWQNSTDLKCDGNIAVGKSQIGLCHNAVEVSWDVARGRFEVGGHIELDAQLSGRCCVQLEGVKKSLQQKSAHFDVIILDSFPVDQ